MPIKTPPQHRRHRWTIPTYSIQPWQVPTIGEKQGELKQKIGGLPYIEQLALCSLDKEFVGDRACQHLERNANNLEDIVDIQGLPERNANYLEGTLIDMRRGLAEQSPPLSGASWEAALAYGMADFVAQRAKAELREWVVQSALTDLCEDNKSKYIKQDKEQGVKQARKSAPYLHHTCVLQTLYDYGMPGTEGILIKALRKDLQSVPGNLIWNSDLAPT